MRETPRFELEPVSWATEPMFWVLCDGAVVGTVLPLPNHAVTDGTPRWLASACEEMGGASWPCESQAAAVEWLMRQTE